jgi:hypothetical protein
MEEMEEVTAEATPPKDTAESSGTASAETPAAPPEPVLESTNKTARTVGIVLGALAVVVVVSAVVYLLVSHPDVTSILRDISIIVLALVTIVVGVFLAVLIFQLQSLIVLLRDEIYPILESVNQTANTVRGTTTFVSDAVVSPMISVASFASAVGQTLRVLTGTPSRKKKARPTPENKPQAPVGGETKN